MEQGEEGMLSPVARDWLHEVAKRDYGGDVGRAAAAIIEAACEAEMSPDRWAYVKARARSKVRG